MRVKIDAGGRVVEIECADVNTSPSDVADRALKLWQDTDGARDSVPAYGYQGERRNGQTSATHSGRWGRPFADPRAEDTP